MELYVHRTEDNKYQMLHGDQLLVESTVLSELLSKAEIYAKRFRKNLNISLSAISDWYVGFPKDQEQSPEIFYDVNYQVTASAEGFDSPYKFVEGPFASEELAGEACFKMSGKTGTVKGE